MQLETQKQMFEQMLKQKTKEVIYYDLKLLYPDNWLEKIKELLPLLVDAQNAQYIKAHTMIIANYAKSFNIFSLKKDVVTLFPEYINCVDFSDKQLDMFYKEYTQEKMEGVIKKGLFSNFQYFPGLVLYIEPKELKKTNHMYLKNNLNLAQYLYFLKIDCSNLCNKFDLLMSNEVIMSKNKKISYIEYLLKNGCSEQLVHFAKYQQKLSEANKSIVALAIVRKLKDGESKKFDYITMLENFELKVLEKVSKKIKNIDALKSLIEKKKLLHSTVEHKLLSPINKI